MKVSRILIALALFILPLAVRTLWYYQGIYQRTTPVEIPNYTNYQITPAPLSTSAATLSLSKLLNQNIVVDLGHANLFTLNEIAPFTHSLNQQGGNIVIADGTTTPLVDQLKSATAYIVIAPAAPFTQADLNTIEHFVSRGGRLLVIADPTRSVNPANAGGGPAPTIPPVEVTNLILAPFGLDLSDDYLYNTVENDSNFRNVILKDFKKSPITENLGQVIFYSTHSLKTSPKPLIVSGKGTYSSLTDSGDGYVVAGTDQNEQVLAMGDFSFMINPYDHVADNQLLIDGISRFLVSGTHVHDLVDYPYLFTRPVTVLNPNDSTLQTGNLSTISSVQKALTMVNIPMQLSNKPTPGNDLILSGLFSQNDQFSDYLKPFDLKFDIVAPEGTIPSIQTYSATPSPSAISQTPEAGGGIPGGSSSSGNGLTPIPMPISNSTITIPGIGKVSTNGLGLLLFSTTRDRNTLIIMADTEEALSELAGILSSGTLSNCTVQSNIGLCSLSTPSNGVGR